MIDSFEDIWDAMQQETSPLDSADGILSYKPRVRDGQWFISEIDLEWIADGCYGFSCGGGGSLSHVFLELREMVREDEVICVID